MINLDEIVTGYLECAEWADKPEGSNARFSRAEIAIARKVCAKFVAECGPAALQAVRCKGYSAARFGHDFWLTRCGHGAGFWDRDELDCAVIVPQSTIVDRDGNRKPANVETLGDLLTAIAYGTNSAISPFAYPSLDAYRGRYSIDGSAEYWARGHVSPWGYWAKQGAPA